MASFPSVQWFYFEKGERYVSPQEHLELELMLRFDARQMLAGHDTLMFFILSDVKIRDGCACEAATAIQ